MRSFADRLNHYRFHSQWEVPGDYDWILGVLQDISSYPRWWPEVREVTWLGPSRVEVRIRALLPYSLRFEMEQVLVDPQAGVLRATLAGDLEGWSQWTLAPAEDAQDTEDRWLLTFDEDVIVKKRSMRLFGPLARPVFRLNHASMMSSARKGLAPIILLDARVER